MNRNASEMPKIDTFAARADQVLQKNSTQHAKNPIWFDVMSNDSDPETERGKNQKSNLFLGDDRVIDRASSRQRLNELCAGDSDFQSDAGDSSSYQSVSD